MAAIVRVSRPVFLLARDLTSERCPREETGRKPKLRVLSDFRKKVVNPIAALTDIDFAIYMR